LLLLLSLALDYFLATMGGGLCAGGGA